MIIAVLSISLTLILGTVCSVFAQSGDIGSVLDKAQKSLSQNTEDNIEPTLLESDYKSYENQKVQCKDAISKGLGFQRNRLRRNIS